MLMRSTASIAAEKVQSIKEKGNDKEPAGEEPQGVQGRASGGQGRPLQPLGIPRAGLDAERPAVRDVEHGAVGIGRIL